MAHIVEALNHDQHSGPRFLYRTIVSGTSKKHRNDVGCPQVYVVFTV